MSETVVFGYDGRNYVTATIGDAVPGATYALWCDVASLNPEDTAVGTTLVLALTDAAAGAAAGETFRVGVQRTDDAPATGFYILGDANLEVGTPGGQYPFAADWSYDGDKTITVAFDGEDGVGYFADANAYKTASPGYVQAADTETGAGVPLAITLVLGDTPVGSFDAFLQLPSSPEHSDASLSCRRFVGGEAGAGIEDEVVALDPPPPPRTAWAPGRRVGIAFDDGPLEPDPTWTWLDDNTTFPPNFVAGYDTKNGRQTLISQTETGTATVYINDRTGLFDDRNDASPYQGKLSGRQIILQLFNPVTETWEPQFRGLIDDYHYDIDGSAVDANGDPINANIQLECVDMFDYLNGYLLTPGLAGISPPTGMEDGVWYPQTTEGVQPRFIEILTDVGIDPAMYHIAQGNVNVIGVKYDPDESALGALRDAADAELPFIANIYVNRYGQFIFRGRYSRFDPDTIASEPGSTWDFQRWPLGDGKAIRADPTRGQVRVLAYSRSRADLINAALAYPQGIKAADMPGQVYASTASIDANGKHQAAPMSDLLTCEPTSSGYDKLTETAKFAELLVENKKQPHLAVTALQLKSMRPDDPRAEATWGPICGADISHIVNVAVGYPGGTGLTGESPGDDHYIEGRSLTVRPLNLEHDYVECDLEVSPAIWSMDTHGVFPPL